MEKINNEYYVSLELAKLLKAAGFDWETEYAYVDELFCPMRSFSSNFNSWGIKIHEFVSAPTLDVAQRWLREVKGYSIYPTYGGYKIYVLDINDSAGFSRTYGLNSNLTYEEAQEVGEKKALEIILEKGE